MKTKRIFNLYIIVGGTCASIDLLIFKLLLLLSFDIVISAVISFSIATILNYLMCRYFIFNHGEHNFYQQFTSLVIVSMIGVFFNVGIVYILTAVYNIPPLISKITAIGAVFLWNFFGRLLLVFKKNY